MNKPSWITLSKHSGSGNGSFNVSASKYTGRVQRTGSIRIVGEGVSEQKIINIKQVSKPTFVKFNTDTATIDAIGGVITIKGKSNAAKLQFKWEPIDGQNVEYERDVYGNEKTNIHTFNKANLPTSYLVNNTEITNGVTILNDPGANEEYEFTISIQIPFNDCVVDVYRILNVIADDSSETTSQTIIRQQAAEPRITISHTEVDFDSDADTQTVNIITNDKWVVSSKEVEYADDSEIL